MTILLFNKRWHLSLVFMVTLFVAFIDRLNITYALPLMADEYGWTAEQLQDYGSQLLGLFYVAYGLSNIFLTPFAARFGTRTSLMVIICLWAFFTALGAFVSQFLMLLLATRILLGLAEGVHVPMMMTTTKAWFPPHERSRANSIVAAGIFLALLLSPLVLVPLMSHFGWRAGFHVLALIGLLISLPLVYFFVYNRPAEHPTLSAQELSDITEGTSQEETQQESGLSLRQAIRIPGYLWLLAVGACNGMIGVGLSSWIPTYFTRVRGIPFEDVAWLVVGPNAFSLLGLALWAYLGDRFNVRGLIIGLCAILGGLTVFIAMQVASLAVFVGLFSLAVFLLCSFQATEFALLQRIVPHDKFAHLAGLYNGLSIVIGGGLGPALLAPIISTGEGTWAILLIASVGGLLSLNLYRILRY